MSVTVSQICALPFVKNNTVLVAGKEGLQNIVREVTVMEVPDFAELSYLGSHLFILTTLYTFQNDRELVFERMRRLSARNTAAIAVKVNRFVDNVPDVLIEAADYYHLPLFAVQKETRFSELISAISTEIINEQFHILKDLETQREIFLSAILRGDDIELFVRILGENLHKYCACVAVSGQVLAQYQVPGEQEDTNSVESTLTKLIRAQNLSASDVCHEDYTLYPCLVRNQVMAYLIVRSGQGANKRELLYGQQAASYISIKLLEKHLMFEAEQRAVISIADEILFRHHTDESIIRERVKLLGLEPQKFYFIAIVSFREENSKDILQIELRQWVDRLGKIFPNHAIFIKATEVVAIASYTDKSPHAQRGTIKRALTGVMQEYNGADVGYSLIVTDIRQLADCYEQAKRSLSFGRAFRPHSRVFSYHDFIEKGLLLHSLETREHDIIVKKLIEPIKNYDSKYNSGLWATLEKCLIIGSLEKAAQDLHIHSSTLRYRLQRIKEITDVDFFSPDGRFLLNLAYILSKL